MTNLLVVGEGMTTGLGFNGVNSIKIPLKITADVTQFQFILNFGNTITPALVNSDVVQFNYTRNNQFVSRACGYKTLFTLDETNPYALSELEPAGTPWIKNIIVNQYQISNENETHFKVFFSLGLIGIVLGTASAQETNKDSVAPKPTATDCDWESICTNWVNRYATTTTKELSLPATTD